MQCGGGAWRAKNRHPFCSPWRGRPSCHHEKRKLTWRPPPRRSGWGGGGPPRRMPISSTTGKLRRQLSPTLRRSSPPCYEKTQDSVVASPAVTPAGEVVIGASRIEEGRRGRLGHDSPCTLGGSGGPSRSAAEWWAPRSRSARGPSSPTSWRTTALRGRCVMQVQSCTSCLRVGWVARVMTSCFGGASPRPPAPTSLQPNQRGDRATALTLTLTFTRTTFMCWERSQCPPPMHPALSIPASAPLAAPGTALAITLGVGGLAPQSMAAAPAPALGLAARTL